MSTEPLLIHPPPYLYSGRDPFGHVGDVVPIGLLAIAEYLQDRGWQPVLLRLPVIGRLRAQSRGGTLLEEDWDAILRVALERHPARVIGIQCHWTHYAEGATDVAARIRALDPTRFILLGGVHAASLGRRLLEECAALDAVVLGEGELPMERLLESFRAIDPSTRGSLRSSPLDAIPSLLTREEARAAASTSIARSVPALLAKEEIPPLRFDLSLLEPAHGAVFVGVPVVRGLCPKPCTYCELNNRALFPRKQILLDDALEVQIAHAARARVPLYLPENFIGGRPLARLLRRLHGLSDSGPIYVDCHPDMLTDEAVDALGEVAASGTRLRLWLGLESGSPEVRRRAGRTYDATRVFALRDRLLAAGIRPVASFLVGLPGEGPDQLGETRAWIERWNERGLIADVFPALAFPGTSLFLRPEEHGITLRMVRARDFARLSRGWFAPLSTDPLTHTNGMLDESAVVRQVLALRLEQRQRLGAPLAQEVFTFMGHPAAPWNREQWMRAIESLEPHWPAGIDRPSLPSA
ncbi:MAG: cobalamin-dependent protein [Candidatus Eisenbacteria bacterium]